MSLRIVLHRKIPEDPKLCRQWNGLALQMERAEVFYTFDRLQKKLADRAGLTVRPGR